MLSSVLFYFLSEFIKRCYSSARRHQVVTTIQAAFAVHCYRWLRSTLANLDSSRPKWTVLKLTRKCQNSYWFIRRLYEAI